jgi:hypothetical protein
MAFYFVSTFAIAQTPTKQPALRLSRTKNLHFAKATFPGFTEIPTAYRDRHRPDIPLLVAGPKPSFNLVDFNDRFIDLSGMGQLLLHPFGRLFGFR